MAWFSFDIFFYSKVATGEDIEEIKMDMASLTAKLDAYLSLLTKSTEQLPLESNVDNCQCNEYDQVFSFKYLTKD